MNARRTAALSAFTIIFILGGCAGHQQITEPPSLSIPDVFLEAPGPASSPSIPIGQWWREFGDEQLDRLMDDAFSGNLDLAQAYARLAQLRAAARGASSALSPSLSVGGQLSRDHQPGSQGSITGTNYRLSLQAGYEVDLWNKHESRAGAAEYAADAAGGEIESLYLSLSAQIVDLYYLAVEQRTQLDLTDQTIASFQEILERVEDRYRQGLVPALDIYQARQNLSLAQSRRPLFQSLLARTEHALSILAGKYPDSETAGTLAVLPPSPEAFPAGLPSEVLARRPDVKAAFLRLRAADARVAAAVADRFPSFNLLAGFGVTRSSSPFGDATGIFWNLLAGFAQPLFDSGRLEAEEARTRAAFDEVLARYRQTALRAFGEVEDALSSGRATEKRIEMLGERVDAAAEALRLSTDRYLQGLSTYLPVLTAQSQHFEARSLLLSARRQLISDRVSLARALGGEWMAAEIMNRAGRNKENPEDERTP